MVKMTPYLKTDNGLIERIFWLIRLRWIAFAGVFIAIFFANNIAKLSLPVLNLYLIAFFLGAYNLLFFFLTKQLKDRKDLSLTRITNRIANLQIAFDLVTLSVLIHFSGGIENPFLFYFVFHMIISSILLSRRAAFLQATVAVALFFSVIILEYFGIIRHYCLNGFIPASLHNNFTYVIGVCFVFVSALYISTYLASSISRKLKERERNLKETNELLTEKDRIKSEYVLRVTHDIKEHLAAIGSCIEPVTGGITGSLNEKQMDLLRRADERTRKLLFFVKALLEITRIKLSKEMKMDYCSFQDILTDAITHIALKAKEKNITVNSTVEPSIDKIRCAKEYIQEAISNLLANAIKYTPRNGRIDVRASDKGNSILIEISDNGIGIPQAELPRIFEEFYRASNAKEVERDGTGLGLSIAKQVVERHQGKIWVESQEGKGSTFYIILPK